MANRELKNEKKTAKIQWFFFVIFIPIVFAVTLTLVVLTIAGINVFEKVEEYGSQVPGIEKLFSGEEDSEMESTTELKAQIENKQAQLDNQTSQLEQKDNEIQKLQEQIEQLNDELSTKQAEEKTREERIEAIASTFEAMEPENAAPRIEKMEQKDAISILENLPSDKRGKIFEEMSLEASAKLASAMLNPTTVDTDSTENE